MKHYFSSMMIALALALALVMGVVALAENAEPSTGLPAAGDLQTPTEEPQDSATDTQDDTALQEALKAYDEARQSSQAQDLQDELDSYVAAGKLTQEQADLIMNHFKEREALRNGTCPNCGYQFQNGTGKGGRMNGGNGFGRGGKGMGGMGGMGGRGGYGRQMMPGQANGMDVQPDMQAAPQAGNGI